jgi:hypothetical protein
MRKLVWLTIIISMVSAPVYGANLHHSAYIGGYPDGCFRPNEPVTRAEVAKLVVSSNGKKLYPGSSFYDVSESHWASAYIYTAKRENYIGGYDDGSYRPSSSIRRGEFAAIVYRTIQNYVPEDLKNDRDYKIKDISSHWSGSYVNVLNKLGVIRGYSDGRFNPDGMITRAEAVAIINRVQGRIPDIDRIDSMKKTVYKDKDIKAHWAYYEIIESSVDHDFYIIKDGENNQREFWTKFYF